MHGVSDKGPNTLAAPASAAIYSRLINKFARVGYQSAVYTGSDLKNQRQTASSMHGKLKTYPSVIFDHRNAAHMWPMYLGPKSSDRTSFSLVKA